LVYGALVLAQIFESTFFGLVCQPRRALPASMLRRPTLILRRLQGSTDGRKQLPGV